MIELKVNGKKLDFFNSFSFSDRIDSIAGSISFSSFVDIGAYDYANVEAYRDGVLIFTGEIVNKDVPNETPPKPFTYKAESLTHILSCTLPIEAYPLQIESTTLKDTTEHVCSFFDVVSVFDQSAEEEANENNKLSDLKLAESASKIINDLVTNKGIILTHDAYGRLIITKDITQNETVLPKFTSDKKAYDLKNFYHTYVALGQAPVDESEGIQAIARFTNIDQRRNTTKIQDSGDINTIEKKAEGMRADSLKSIKQRLSFNNFFCNIGDYVFDGDLKLIINEINYTYSAGSEITSVSLLDSQIYER